MSTSSAAAITSSYTSTNPDLATSPRLTKSWIRREVSYGVATSAARSRSTVHVAALIGGSFVAVWTEADGDAPVGGSGSGIAARVDNGAGAPATFLIVNTSVAGDQAR